MATAPIIRKPMPRKPLQKRLFTGMAGSPLARFEETPAPESPAANPMVVSMTVEEIPSAVTPQQSIAQAEEAVRILLEAVAPIEGTNRSRNRKVKKVMQEVLAGKPAEIIPEPSKTIPTIEVLPEPPETVTPVPYNPKAFETEIEKVLNHSSARYLTAADKDDLRQIIQIELWQASEKYGDKLNAKLTYTIAWNQFAKYIDNLAKQPRGPSLDVMPTKEDEEIGVSNQAEKEALGLTNIGSPGNGTWTKLGVKTWEPTGHPLVMGKPTDWMEALEERGGIPMLERYVKRTYKDKKKLVAMTMLGNPEMTVRDIPNIPKTTVHRLRQEILEDFERLVREPLPKP